MDRLFAAKVTFVDWYETIAEAILPANESVAYRSFPLPSDF